MTESSDVPNPASRFHLRTLGTLALVDSAGETILGAHGHHKRRLALVSVLAAAGQLGRSRDQLLLLFWPEATQSRARHSLDQLLYAIRNSLGEDVFDGVNPVRLNETIVKSDVGAFLSALEQKEYGAAVELYRGAFLDGFHLDDSPEFEQWIDAERGRLASRYTDALEQLARGAETVNDHGARVRWRRVLAEADPLSSQYAAGYMRALTQAGDDAAALRHAERHSAALSQELGVDAGPEVASLVAGIRAKPRSSALAAELPDAAPAVVSTNATGVGDGTTRAIGAPAPRRRRWALYAAGLLLAALSVAAAQWAVRLRRASAEPRAERSIVVLPLAKVGGDAQDAALLDGLTDELIGVLAKLGQFKVIAHTSAFKFKNSDLDVRRIADSLGVRYVLVGSVQPDGPKFRVRMQLVDARDGSTPWAESYDGELRDMFRVQSEIAGAVARELDVRLGAGVLAKIKHGSTANVAAYELYLKGNDPTLLRTNAGAREALDDLERAVSLDPNFAAAYAARARLIERNGGESFSFDTLKNGTHTTMSPRERSALAEQSARKALALDDSLADAHAALGLLMRNRFEIAAGEAELKRAVALEPATARFHEWLVQMYVRDGRTNEALAEGRRAIDLDPLSPTANAELARALLAADRPDEALAVLAPLKSLPQPLLRAGEIAAECYARKRMWAEALAELQPNLANSNIRGTAFRGYLLARAGRTTEARQILASLVDRSSHFGGHSAEIATVYVGLGETDHALAWVDKAREERSLPDYFPMVLNDLPQDRRVNQFRERFGIQKR